MNLHLAEIAKMVAPGAHAVLLVDQAGWHMSTRLAVPHNITIIALPPKCPELNPVENVWQFIPNRTTRDPCVTLWRACDVRQVFDLTHVYDAFTPHNIGQYESRFLSFGISLRIMRASGAAGAARLALS